MRTAVSGATFGSGSGAQYDYGRLSADELRERGKSEQYYQMMLASGKTEAEAEMVRDVFLAKEEYLDAAFSAMDAQYENVDTFLRDGLHIPQNLIEHFQSSVL